MNVVDISEFYDYETLTAKLREIADAAPDLVTMSSIGQSEEGRDLWCLAVAGDGGPPVEYRPATLVTANMHARELAGSWVSLHLLDHLVSAYPEGEVGDLLDEGVFYVVPRVTPDGAESVLDDRGRVARSRDIDFDEEEMYEPNTLVPRDLNGDGRVLTMRWPAADGDHVLAEDGRLTVPAGPEESDAEFYRTALEGEVLNYDGGPLSEPTRSDFNRNFPSEAWRPFEWIGHGDYPLSEPETRALAEFVYDHPNVTTVLDLHTGNPALFYPSKTQQPDPLHDEDADLIERLGKRGEELTGFPYLASYAEARGETREVELPGSFKDFVYERHGAPAFVVELGMLYNYLGFDTEDIGIPHHEHQRATSEALLEYHEEHPERGLFNEWESHDHPQLGEVEIGGWDWIPWSNPPLAEMPGVAERVTEFALEVAEERPDLRLPALDAERVDVAAGDGEAIYRITARVVNRGSLPTSLTERGRETHHRARPRVRLRADEDREFVAGQERETLDHLDANGGSASLEWVLRAPAGSEIELEAFSPRGAYVRGTATLGE